MTELLAPAGDFETALAAFAAGADAVYCGLADYSARAFAKNLSADELKSLLAYARAQTPPRRVYVAFNTLVEEGELESAAETLSQLEAIGPDALIVQDLGVARLCRTAFPSLVLHASTQLVAHNLEGVLQLKELGFRRVVLARELSLEEIASIARRCGDLELEVFIHGALCYSISGLCLYGAMEKGRSGNRGKCPYCCRQCVDGRYPFSMKDLRLGEDVRHLAEAGVDSLKIEGRMKSPLYVASVTEYYRQILDGKVGGRTTVADLETVFSRHTTELYFNGRGESPIDSESLGHCGALIGKVKKVTRDREGLAWLRFHTARALEKHDGLQFDLLTDEGRHFGFGITRMRQAISRYDAFEVAAGTDVEILLPEDGADAESNVSKIKPGMNVYCSMSNAVKRRFPAPSFRPSDFPGNVAIDLEVTLASDAINAVATINGERVEVRASATLTPAKNPEKTLDSVRRAFAKLGGTDYRLKDFRLDDGQCLFAPASILNDLRRDLIERLDAHREHVRRAHLDLALSLPSAGCQPPAASSPLPSSSIKLRADQQIPPGEWDEIVLAVNPSQPHAGLQLPNVRYALPVYTSELEFNRLRNLVKKILRDCPSARFECSDLATLRMLKALGAEDITADWSLYAFNSAALAEVFGLGVKGIVASPENSRENLQFLAESGYPVTFLKQQSTPLFISLTEPASRPDNLAIFRKDGLWVTTRPAPRTFDLPEGVPTRIDLSWDLPVSCVVGQGIAY